jgi:hypothetical protein
MQEFDPSSHAEVRAIRKATKRLKQFRSPGYTLYTTCEPCPMCMSAALWAGLDRVVYGATIVDANRHCNQIHIPATEVPRAATWPASSTAPCSATNAMLSLLIPTCCGHFASGLPAGASSFELAFSKGRSYAPLACRGDCLNSLPTPPASSRARRARSPLARLLLVLAHSSATALDKVADVVVQPISVDEILALSATLFKTKCPVTVRGAGTGNYGQCVPLEGGIVLDLQLMDKLEEITADGVAVCQPGLRLGVLETEARKQGWELRMYPSTLAKASVGGFLGGGSGGIGSVAHGGLRDFDNVRAFEVVTMEDKPRVVLHEGAAVHEILHAWGTNGILTRIWFRPRPPSSGRNSQRPSTPTSKPFRFTQSIAVDSSWTKRLATVFEWPIPSFFAPIKQVVREGKSLALS